MAKGNSKSKPLKFQTYRVPKNHYFFVLQNPWPFGTSPTSNSQSFFNAVAAWLSFMIHDLCDLDISTTQLVIYWQSTHRDLIADIEIPLPASGEDLAVILSQILGAHRSSQFLIPEYAGHGDHTIVVWEYNLERQNHPDKTNWNAASATYTSLPDNFPVKRGDPLIPTRQMYPPPGVPKNVTQLKWCKPLPTRLREGHPDCVPIPLQPAPPPTTLPQPSAHAPALVPPSANHNDKNFLANANTASSSRSKGHPPGAEPSALRSGSPATGEQPPQSEFAFTPYERPPHFPVTTHLARSLSPASPSPTPSPPPGKLVHKRDPYEEEADALDQLRSLTTVKSEDSSFIPSVKQEHDSVSIKSEYVDSLPVKQEAYHPDLLTTGEKFLAFSRAQASRSLTSSSPAYRSAPDYRVKPQDDSQILVKSEPQADPKIRVKPEPEDDRTLSSSSTSHVKKEQDDHPMPFRRPAIKTDPDAYEPSQELLDTFSRYQASVQVGVMDEEDDLNSRGVYRESHAPPVTASSRTYSPPQRVKQEDSGRVWSGQSQQDGRYHTTTLADPTSHGRSRNTPDKYTKREPTDPPLHHIKRENVDGADRDDHRSRQRDGPYRTSAPSGATSFPERPTEEYNKDYPGRGSGGPSPHDRRESVHYPQAQDERHRDRAGYNSTTINPSSSRQVKREQDDGKISFSLVQHPGQAHNRPESHSVKREESGPGHAGSGYISRDPRIRPRTEREGPGHDGVKRMRLD